MKVLITGGHGQLGISLQKQLYKLGMTVFAVGHSQMDITNPSQVRETFAQIGPDAVIHCAAYNKVDLAEKEAVLCRRVNVEGTKIIADACKETGAYLVYTSSDYVFDGTKDSPYEVMDEKHPLSVYGRSKADGEEIVLERDSANAVLRISWLFGPSENNFVKAILRAAQKNYEIDVVSDQVGNPTYTEDLAVCIGQMLCNRPGGIYHATNEGSCSRADFAKEIIRLANLGTTVREIPTIPDSEKAMRPKNSILSKSCLDDIGLQRLPAWENAVARYLDNRVI